MLRTVVLSCLIATPALAVPTTVTHQGRALSVFGEPLNGDQPVTVAIVDDPDPDQGSSYGTFTGPIDFDDGYYTVMVPGIDNADLVGERWLSVTINGTEMLPRPELHTVPFATHAAGVTLTDVALTCNASTTTLHGTLRYHDDGIQACTTSGWSSIAGSGPSGVSATGGLVTDIGGHRIHTFYQDGSFVVGSTSGTVEVLVVGGGGGGGGRAGGGGGAGGVVYDASYAVSAGQSITVSVGNGGVGGFGGTSSSGNGQPGGVGENSSFGSITAAGGGFGGSDGSSLNASSGGSGGGAMYQGSPGSGTVGQGTAGGGGVGNAGSFPYQSGGGGGAGGAGESGTQTRVGDGGVGVPYTISGRVEWYGGGGGGGAHEPCPSDLGVGGRGGGGDAGACGNKMAGEDCVDGTGGGGGAGSTTGSFGGAGGDGGDGIVIVRYPL